MLQNGIRILALCLLATAHGASALEISLDPRYVEASLGEQIKLDIVIDAAEVVLGGGWDVVYDADAFEFVDFSYGLVGQPGFQPPPTLLPGRIESMGAGSFFGISEGVMATVTFNVVGHLPAVIALTDTGGTAGPWFSGVDFQIVEPAWRDAVVIERGGTYPSMRLSSASTVSGITPGDTIFTTVSAFNDGTGNLDISGISLDPSEIGTYFISDDGCSGNSIEPDAQCDVEIGFIAVDERPFEWSSVEVFFASNDLIPIRQSTRVNVRTLAPKFEQVNVQFLEASVGGPFSRERIIMRNTGTWEANVERLLVSQFPNDPDMFFVINDGCEGQTVPVGGTCTIDLEFRPTQEGSATGSYTMYYGHSPLSVRSNLRGATRTGIPVVSYDGPNVFESVVGEQTVRRMFVTNKGSLPLTIERDPPDNDLVTVIAANCAGQAIVPGDSCYADLLITPTSVGTRRWRYRSDTNSFVSVVDTSIAVTGIEAPGRRGEPKGRPPIVIQE